jgi:hypothetical protein
MFGLEGYLNAKEISVRHPTEQQIAATTGGTALSAVVMVMPVMMVVRRRRVSNTCDCGNSD